RRRLRLVGKLQPGGGPDATVRIPHFVWRADGSAGPRPVWGQVGERRGDPRTAATRRAGGGWIRGVCGGGSGQLWGHQSVAGGGQWHRILAATASGAGVRERSRQLAGRGALSRAGQRGPTITSTLHRRPTTRSRGSSRQQGCVQRIGLRKPAALLPVET